VRCDAGSWIFALRQTRAGSIWRCIAQGASMLKIRACLFLDLSGAAAFPER
jgi:hypothetical protein